MATSKAVRMPLRPVVKPRPAEERLSQARVKIGQWLERGRAAVAAFPGPPPLPAEETSKVPRFLGPGLCAVAFIFGLFWLLHHLISGGGGSGNKTEALPTIDFVRLNKAFEVETRERTPPKMPDKPEAPPEVTTPQAQIQAPDAQGVDFGRMNVGKDVSLAGLALAASDGEYLPIVKVAPMYPSRAQSLGLEGWVLLKFTVTEAGTVKDPEVLEADPPGTFDEAAKRAVLKFKYKPRIENGKPMAVSGVKHLISFKIEKDK